MNAKDSDQLTNPALYVNRELSLIQFNKRVLAQAQNINTPLLERLKYLCISSSNLDEFFEVRIASIKQQLDFAGKSISPDGLSPGETLRAVRTEAQKLVDQQYSTLNHTLLPALERQGIRFLRRSRWKKNQKEWLENYFQTQIMPVLSPLGLDPSHPFPRILNKSLNFLVSLEGKDAFGRERNMALVRTPRSLPRVIRLPESLSKTANDFVFLSSVIHGFVDQLFPGLQVTGCHQFRVTRNSELFVDEEEVENLARALQGELLERAFAKAVRLEIADNCPQEVEQYLLRRFELKDEDLYRCNGPVNLHRMMTVYGLIDDSKLKFKGFKANIQNALKAGVDFFASIQEKDYLLHHPFDSFSSVTEFLKQAALDPNVLAIKQTLYRTGANSSVVQYLAEAARNGKDVTAVVELRARFDEEANINLSEKLQEAGVQVVYGVVGYKTHAKMLLIVRREAGELKRYAHLGTGNYHQSTSSAYTDIGLLTSKPSITEDVHHLFQELTALGPVFTLNTLLHSPFTLHKGILKKIAREAELAKTGQAAHIVAKMNSLTEPLIIRALYQASQAGVEIDLIIRGVCCLRPGVQGISENIRVRSIVGRFLEHSRMYYFHNNGNSEMFASSADWMDRNLFRRVETCFPIQDESLLKRLKTEQIDLYLKDNADAWIMQEDGSYQPAKREGKRKISAQLKLLQKHCK